MTRIDSEIEKSAFALFTRSLDPEYKRALCYMVYRTVEKNKVMQLGRLVHDLSIAYGYNREDLKSCVSVLKSPFAFKAIESFLSKDKKNQLVRLTPNSEGSVWIKELETKYPHFSRML